MAKNIVGFRMFGDLFHRHSTETAQLLVGSELLRMTMFQYFPLCLPLKIGKGAILGYIIITSFVFTFVSCKPGLQYLQGLLYLVFLG